MSKRLKLALGMGYWVGRPPQDAISTLLEAERLGFDSVWCSEGYGSDAVTPLAWWGSRTERLRLGTAVMQMSARQPTATAMAAMTLDHLSGGRFSLGLGVSGPQVAEGWYGMPFEKPLARTREYVGIVRKVWERDAPVTSVGPHYQLPLVGGLGVTGLGKPLKSSIRPLRSDIPLYLAAEGPKNIALAAELGDGWIAMLISPDEQSYRDALDEGFARPTSRPRGPFDVVAAVPFVIHDQLDVAIDTVRPYYALYLGGMGARGGKNFHANVAIRMGYEREVAEIQELYLQGRKNEAAARVPRELMTSMSLLGPADKIRHDLQRWEDSFVTTLMIHGDRETLRQAAELVLG